jgi:plastocyanin
MRTRAMPCLLGGVVVALAAAAAGQADNATTLHLKANPAGKIRYDKKTLSAEHGRVVIVMRNPSTSGLHHGIAVEGKGVDKDGKIVAPGKTSKHSLKLKPGRYTFYCNNDRHRQLGMKGTLVVK